MKTNDDYDIDYDMDNDDYENIEPDNENIEPNLVKQPTDKRAAEFSDMLFGPSETGLAYGNIYTRNVPIKDISKTRRADIIAKGNKYKANYVPDYDADNLHSFKDAWKDAEDVLKERKLQEIKSNKPNKKTRKGGARKTKAKKHRKTKKNKSSKSSRRNHKK